MEGGVIADCLQFQTEARSLDVVPTGEATCLLSILIKTN